MPIDFDVEYYTTKLNPVKQKLGLLSYEPDWIFGTI